MDKFKELWNQVALEIHENAARKGFWDTSRNMGEMIALIHSELSEALEGIRHGNPLSDKIPEYTAAEEEFADAVIRIMDTTYAYGWDIVGAIRAKMLYNASRPYKHGKES